MEKWMDVVMPYPTLSQEFGNIFLINDVIKTKLPAVVLGCVQADKQDHAHLVEYLCHYDSNEVMYFDDDKTLIKLFQYSISELDEEAKEIMAKRMAKKYGG